MWKNPNNTSKSDNGSQLPESYLKVVAVKMICFLLREFIHESGKYFDKSSDVAKHKDLADWVGQGVGTGKEQIEKNRKVEQERQDSMDQSWPREKK